MLKRQTSLPLEELAKRQRTSLTTEEILGILQTREAHRASKRFEEADALRTELRAAGVELINAEREWRASDGRRGVIAAVVANTATAATPRTGSELSDEAIAELVAEREKARQAQNFPRADELRSQMRDQGVELLDKERIWRSSDGRMGLLPGKLTDEAIHHLVSLRESERATRNFDAADRLRQALREVGVRLDDKNSTWTTDDGRTGHFGPPGMAGMAAVMTPGLTGGLTPANMAAASIVAGQQSVVSPLSFTNPALAAFQGGAMAATVGGAAVANLQMRTISELEIMVLVRQYEESRASQDALVQEAVETVLRERGIALDAATLSWRAIDGRSGPIFYADAHAYRAALTAAACNVPGLGLGVGVGSAVTPAVAAVSAGTTAGSDDLEGLLQLREQARARRDFALADRLRESLRAQGVQMNDPQEEYVLPDGRHGNYASLLITGTAGANESTSSTMTDEEILGLVAQRENARKQRDFVHADAIRTRMRAFGVTLDDRERQWTTNDGRSGRWE